METVHLHRTNLFHDRTTGVLEFGQNRLATIEPPIRFRKTWPFPPRYLTPPGRYPLRKTWSPRFGKSMYEIQDVEGHDGLLIHWGNFVEQSHGCPLIGLKHGMINGMNAVLDSRRAYKVFEEYCDHFNILEIVITEPAETC